jgi:hypothetical protein
MADQNKITPWPRVQYPWVNTNPDLQSREAYDRRVQEELGDAANPDQTLSKQYGQPVYRRGGANGTAVLDFGKNGSYARWQKIVGQPGEKESVNYPLRPLFEQTDKQASNPWRVYGDTSTFNPAEGAPEARLQRAALVERWNQTHSVDKGNFNALKTGDQILGAMRNDLGQLSDSDLNKWAQFKGDVIGMTGEDLRKNGINPAYQDLQKQIQRANASGLFTQPKGGAPPNPLSQVIAGDPITGGLLAAGNLAYDWLASKPNLTQLRTSLSQDHNKVRLSLFDEVNNDPDGRWAKDDVDYANKTAGLAEKELGHDQDPYIASKPVEEPARAPQPGDLRSPAQVTKQEQQEKAQQQPAAESTTPDSDITVKSREPTETEKAMPGVSSFPGGVVPALKEEAVEGLASNIKTAAKTVGKVFGQTTGPDVEKPTGQVTGPPTAPIGEPYKAAEPTYTEPLTGAPLSQNTGRPGGGAENAEVGSFAPTPVPRLAYQEHVDQLAPGTRFTWHHDGQDYVKT